MVCCQKILLLLWKNWVLRKRHPCACCCELCLPLFCFGFILIMKMYSDTLKFGPPVPGGGGGGGGGGYGGSARNSPAERVFPENVKYSEKDMIKHVKDRIIPGIPANIIGFTPNSTAVRNIVIPMIEEALRENNRTKLNMTIYKNEQVMEAEFQESRKERFLKTRKNFILGVVFEEGLSGDEIGKYVSYKIRPFWEYLNTNELYNNSILKDWEFNSSKIYRESGVLGTQILIDKLLIQEMVNSSEVFQNTELFVKGFPRKKVFESKRNAEDAITFDEATALFYNGVSVVWCLLIVLCFTFMIPITVGELVSEKETGIKELMKMAGLPEWMHVVGWFLNTIIIIIITSATITISLTYKVGDGESFGHQAIDFGFSDPSLMWVVLMLNGIWNFTYCFLIASLFNKPAIATTIGVLYYLICYGGVATGTIFHLQDYSEWAKLLLCFFPNVALQMAFCSLMSGMKGGGKWESMDVSIGFYGGWSNPSISKVMLMMIATSAANIVLSFYMEAIMPKKFGVRKSPLFIFNPLEWMDCLNIVPRSHRVVPAPVTVPALEQSSLENGKENEAGEVVDPEKEKKETENGEEKEKQKNTQGQKELEVKASETVESRAGFEADPEGLYAGVMIKKLRKVFGFGSNKKVAVNDLSVSMYEGQIFCLLGENGAGKTTTMSMLTGLLSPSGGTAEIIGFDIHSGMNQIRRTLGLCPQHNMLFDKLTVMEHLKFFGVLKGLSFNQAAMDAMKLLQVLQIGEKTNQLAPKLSGGQKRRLSLGCALIGNPKVLILDEPTSGMDPEARRAIWDILQTFRRGKTIILSTHYMEEADVLGDRIGIMSAGKLQCCGSSSFLKKYYGAGFCLNMTLKEGASSDKILKAVQKHVEGAKFKESHSKSLTELSIVLPSATSKFPALFKDLIANRGQLNIDEIGVGWTTMDDVFIKVEELNHPPPPDEEDEVLYPPSPEPVKDAQSKIENEKDLQPKQQSKIEVKPAIPAGEQQQVVQSDQQNVSAADGANTEQVSDLPPDMEVQTGPQTAMVSSKRPGSSLFISQTLGLFIKNIKIIYRNRTQVILQALVPILLTIGVVVAGSRFLRIPDDIPDVTFAPQSLRKLNLSEYTNSTTKIYSESTNDFVQAYKNVLGQHRKEDIGIQLNDLEQYFANITESKEKTYVVAAEIRKDKFTAWHSDVALHAAPLSINLFSNALLQSRSDESFKIETSIHPLVDPQPKPIIARILVYPTTIIYTLFALIFALIVSFLWSMVMSVFVTNFVLEPTLERISSGKLLQFMTGVNPVQYWASFFFTDVFLTFLIILTMMVMVFTFEEHELFTEHGGAGVLVLIFVVYCFASIPFAYLYSTFVKTPAEGFKRILCTHLFTGTVLAILSYIFQFVAYAYPSAALPCQILGKVFPGFSLVRVLFTYGRVSYMNMECHVIPQRYLDIACHKDFDWRTANIDKEELDKFFRCCSNHCNKRIAPFSMLNAISTFGTGMYPCFQLNSYFEWYDTTVGGVNNVPGSNYDLITLIFLGIIYIGFIMLIDYGFIMKSAEMLGDEAYPSVSVIDEDVVMEAERVRFMVESRLTFEDALVVSMLSKAFGQFWAVSGLSFGVHYGECFGLLGVNGAGKTTAFKMLTGDAKKSFGEAFMGMLCLSRSTKQFMSRVGYCPQFDGIIEVLSGREMLNLFGRLRGLQGRKLKEEVDKWLKRTGLMDSANVACGKYSGGMKRRLSTAMALIGDPPVILLDEPTSGVDPVSRRRFWKIIGKLKNTGQAVILTSHSMEECEALCNRLGIMVNGEMQCFGGVQHLKNKYAQGYSMTVKLFEDFVHPKPKEVPQALMAPPSQMQSHQPHAPGKPNPVQNQMSQMGPQSPQMQPPQMQPPQMQPKQMQPPQMQPPQMRPPQMPPQQNYTSMASKVGAQLGNQLQDTSPVENPEIDSVVQSIIDTFESCELKDRHMGTLKFQIYDVEGKPPLTYDVLYAKMEETVKKHEGKIEEYAILESTLEDVFLAFAKLQYNHTRAEPSETCGKLRSLLFCC